MRPHYRHTKIVATIGPATESREMLVKLITDGVDVIRLNMAHGTGEWVIGLVKRIREVSKEINRHVAVMMDVKGPEIRTGVVAEPVDLAAGDSFEFFTDTPSAGIRGVVVNYPGLPADVNVGATMLVDSGLIRLEVMEKDETHVRCRVITPGKLGSRRHINLPGVEVNLPSLTEKDAKDIRAGVEAGIVSKIEDQCGVRNLDEIVRASDAVMVARGDLGIEIDYHTLPLVQTRIVEVCLTYGK